MRRHTQKTPSRIKQKLKKKLKLLKKKWAKKLFVKNKYLIANA